MVLLQQSEAEVTPSQQPGKVHQFFNSVAKYFNIPREDYEKFLPEVPLSTEAPYTSPRVSNLQRQDAIPMGMGSSY